MLVKRKAPPSLFFLNIFLAKLNFTLAIFLDLIGNIKTSSESETIQTKERRT